eukprot:scaffold2026_cov78-Cylindrotheca_fusiformis.AAC.2
MVDPTLGNNLPEEQENDAKKLLVVCFLGSWSADSHEESNSRPRLSSDATARRANVVKEDWNLHVPMSGFF